MVETKEGSKSETDEVIARTLMFLVNIRITTSQPSGGVTGSEVEDINIGSDIAQKKRNRQFTNCQLGLLFRKRTCVSFVRHI